jgi:putative chitinase
MSQPTIDWKPVQRKLGLKDDGVAGQKTYAALMAYVAQRPADAAITARAIVLATYAPAYGMTTPARLAEYLAQTCNETGGWTRFGENLNYSAQRLATIWPNRFAVNPRAAPYLPNALAKSIAGNPEAIANSVYGGRMGNTEPGDGWRYRGRCDLQLTGRDNYRIYGAALGIDLLNDPDQANEPELSVRLALEFFLRARVNAAVDAGDFTKARKLTNGGTIGLAEVATRRNRLLAVLQ